MGHDITAFTSSGQRIEGPHFSRYWFPHYEIFDAWEHNDGVSGNGGSKPMPPEGFQRARQVCVECMERAQQHLREIEEVIRHTPQADVPQVNPTQSTSGKPKFFMLVPGDPEDLPEGSENHKPAPQLIQMRDLLDSSDWDDDQPTPPKERLRYARSEVKTFREILDFIDRCIEENAVLIEFW